MPLPPRIPTKGTVRDRWSMLEWHTVRETFHFDMVYTFQDLGTIQDRYEMITGDWFQVDKLNVLPAAKVKSNYVSGFVGLYKDAHSVINNVITPEVAAEIKDQILNFNQMAFYYIIKSDYKNTEAQVAQGFGFGKYALQYWARHKPLLYLQINHTMRYIPCVVSSSDDDSTAARMEYGMNIAQFENLIPEFARTLKDTTKYHMFRSYKSIFKYQAPKETMDPGTDLVPLDETPPGINWPFDLRQIQNHHYRRWFFAQNRPWSTSTNRDCVEIYHIVNHRGASGADPMDSENVWYNVIDMLAFYNDQDVGQRAKNAETYRLLLQSSVTLAETLDACREQQIVKVDNVGQDYMRKLIIGCMSSSDKQANSLGSGYAAFDEFFLKWIPKGKLARRMFTRLRPIEAMTWKIPVLPATAAATASENHDSVAVAIEGLIEFDAEKCGSYVWRAKWMMNCGKKLDVRVIDGRTLISVTDMMNIHGDYGGSGALRKSWSQLKGTLRFHNKGYDKTKPVGVDNKSGLTYNEAQGCGLIYSEPKNGGFVDFIGLLDFDSTILSHIKSAVAQALSDSKGLMHIATGLGSRRSDVITQTHRDELKSLGDTDPEVAAVLWQLLIEVEEQQEAYVTPAQAAIQSHVVESDTLQIRKLELASSERIRQMELKSNETITIASVEATARAEEGKARQKEADGKAREEEAKARQKEADGKAREEEANADARKTEAISKAKEAVAKAREAKEHALRAQWDPAARAAEAAERKAEFELRKERLSKGMNENDGSICQVTTAPVAVGNLSVVAAVVPNAKKNKRIPKRTAAKSLKAPKKDQIKEDVYARRFPPPKYSTTHTGPRRGPVTDAGEDSTDKENVASNLGPASSSATAV